ncbi:hypothetical protein ACWDUL_06915 [Nocardia niigatensis]|nr:hypothetical protein [Nocardia niigatensis]
MSDQDSANQDTTAAEGIAAMMAVWDLKGAADAKSDAEAQEK